MLYLNIYCGHFKFLPQSSLSEYLHFVWPIRVHSLNGAQNLNFLCSNLMNLIRPQASLIGCSGFWKRHLIGWVIYTFVSISIINYWKEKMSKNVIHLQAAHCFWSNFRIGCLIFPSTSDITLVIRSPDMGGFRILDRGG